MIRKSSQRILARCVVCKGDLYETDEHEVWEGGYYCRRHSLTYLRLRAEEYRKSLAEIEVKASQI